MAESKGMDMANGKGMGMAQGKGIDMAEGQGMDNGGKGMDVGKGMDNGGKGNGRLMNMGGNLNMREGSEIYVSTVGDRYFMRATLFHDGVGYGQVKGKGNGKGHFDLMELGGTPIFVGSSARRATAQESAENTAA